MNLIHSLVSYIDDNENVQIMCCRWDTVTENLSQNTTCNIFPLISSRKYCVYSVCSVYALNIKATSVTDNSQKKKKRIIIETLRDFNFLCLICAFSSFRRFIRSRILVYRNVTFLQIKQSANKVGAKMWERVKNMVQRSNRLRVDVVKVKWTHSMEKKLICGFAKMKISFIKIEMIQSNNKRKVPC